MAFKEKFALLNSIYVSNQCLSFVETGTYEARMTIAVTGFASVIRSIELSPDLYQRCVEQVAKKASSHNIKLFCGDSSKKLVEVLSFSDVENPLIWLDAHWSGGKTAKGSINTPIVQELKAIFDSKKSCVVAIDDMWCFDGKNDYPTEDSLRKMILFFWPETSITVKENVLWFRIFM